MHVLILTAGGAGMFCGSCMHDNTWARALLREGVEVSLLPTYTPMLVDEEDLSSKHVFLGGINIYLDYRFPFWKRAPRFMKRWFDSPRLLSLVSRFSASQDASKLGPLTLAMLDNVNGPLVAEMDELARYIETEVRPDVIVFSNALLSGILKHLKKRLDIPICCILQGDDIFLQNLLPNFREKAITAISEQVREFDHILTHSEYYRDYMTEYLRLDGIEMDLLPLGIDVVPYANCRPRHSSEVRKLGYFARIAPEKGLHNLVDAYVLMLERHPELELLAGGYLHPRHQAYLDEQIRKVREVGGKFTYLGSPVTVEEKVAIFNQFDLFSLPTDYHEPKGLSVLEAMASGLAVVQPHHGAFPEILRKTRGGVYYADGVAESHADILSRTIQEEPLRWNLEENGFQRVREHYSSEAMARCSIELFENYIEQRTRAAVST